jgi:glutamine---fructose-6-phosphate transaminase (isomerizing)
MCGVVGVVFDRHQKNLGQIAADLLRTLEYRGYDSTGAAAQMDGPDSVRLVKGVGPPSLMIQKLGIVEMEGSVFCGQVRWATFGAVTDVNSQPHLVRCKTILYGAHNGNVTNCDTLKGWLVSEGHKVLSDNDGEMVVHCIEHFFALEIEKRGDRARTDEPMRRECMRAAICKASHKLEGSFSAVVVDPVTKNLWAIKYGSSLYFGFGTNAFQDSFGIASSDLSSILKMTRTLVPLFEGEFVEYGPRSHQIFTIGSETVTPVERETVRSRLRSKDAALLPPFKTFMDQEISSQEQTCRTMITLFQGGSEAVHVLKPFLEGLSSTSREELHRHLDLLLDQVDDAAIRSSFGALFKLPFMQHLIQSVPEKIKQQGIDAPAEQLADRLQSSEAGFLADLLQMVRASPGDLFAVRVLDMLLEWTEVLEFKNSIDRFVEMCTACLKHSGRIYMVCCGSSFNAAKAAALFFNELAGVEIVPVLPGEFRSQCGNSLKDGDLFISVSQSGETKDVIDVVNQVIATGREIGRIAVVNNINSTLAQEKSHLVIPLRCGQEIAVPATKSYMNQLTMFYCLALRLAERNLADPKRLTGKKCFDQNEAGGRIKRLADLPDLIRTTILSTNADVEKAAHLLYLAPSIHILATRIAAVAKEGALKIREVVLNHTEGFEGSEFKHGPNTILGFNTVFGPSTMASVLDQHAQALDRLQREASRCNLSTDSIRHLVQALFDATFSPSPRPFVLGPQEQPIFDLAVNRNELLKALQKNYPLIYVTGPDERDILLTVSQINTHKIRGANTVIIAEENQALRGAAEKPPAGDPLYTCVCIALPRTDDTLMSVFSSTVVLQRLALKMSLLKMQYLDRLGIKDHGVHPDVPKNVSKSITVD